MHEIIDALRQIEENSEFRVAHDTERERRRLDPTPEERAARERGQAAVERFRRARETRRAQQA